MQLKALKRQGFKIVVKMKIILKKEHHPRLLKK